MPAQRQSRNKELARGIMLYGRRAMQKRTHKHKWVGSGQTRKAKAAPASKPASKWYPADDEKFPLARRFTPKAAKLRSSIKAGSVLILLSGRHRGKRVVFLQQLPSGLLLVTGPYKINGCPLRRVNQAYVIATSTTVDVSGVSVPDSVNDDFFKRAAEESTEEEAGFFQAAPKAVEIPQERKDLQKAIDTALISALDNDQKGYLKARFSLKNGQYPHLMKF